MAKATPTGGVHRNHTLKLAHTAEVAAGDVIVSNNQVLVAVNAAAANAANTYVFSGPVSFPKKASLAVAVGDTVYFDTDPGEITKTEADGSFCGICIEAAVAADTTVQVELMSKTALPTHTHA